MKLAFLGVGALSRPMLENLLADGHEITVWNRTRSKADPLAEAGATVVDTAAEAVEPGGVVMTCLSNDAALNAVLGDGAVFDALGSGGLHVSMSTCSPEMSQTLADAIAEHGGEHLTCPVLGRPDFVEKRSHRYLLSGSEKAIDRVRPALEGISDQLFVIGDQPQAASVAKLCTNFLIAANVELMAESLALATASSSDPEAIRTMWNQTLFPGVVHTGYSRQILDRSFDPLFALRLMLKDVGLFADAADRNGLDAPLADSLKSRFRSAVHAGHGDRDFTAVSELAWNQVEAR